MKKLILSALTALSLVSCGSLNPSYLVSGGVKAAQAASLSNEQIQEYVSASVAQMDAKYNVLPSTNPYVQRLNRITAGITSVEGIPLNFKVYQTSDVNAFACADGSVRVYTGLMDLMDDDEVLGVIGHEIGHVALKHSLKAYKQALMTSAAMDALASTGSGAAVLTNSILGQLGETMATSSFSRKQETAADDYGYEFLKARGKNPWYMGMAFEKLMSQSNSGNSSAVAQMFSSHPDTASRIERVAKKAAADGYTKPGTVSTSSSSNGKSFHFGN